MSKVNETEILYKDKDCVVCIKPVGVSSESTPDKKGMCDILARQLGVEKVYPVHRLDMGVGGIMVYGLSGKGAGALSADVADGSFHKYYTASFYGKPELDEGVYEDLLFKDSSKNKSYVVKRERKGVKKAKLSYRVLSSAEKDGRTVSTAEIYLYTGRSHQIRVQFSHRGMPLVGDGKYGAADNEKNIFLCCTKVVFNRPSDGKVQSFEIPYPFD